MDIINPFSKPITKVETDFKGQTLSLEINRLAFRSQSAVLASYGQTVVLATVNVGDMDDKVDYFPLSVDYEERFYASGKISGSRFIKREGRPSDDAILIGRLIDRPIRPLFPKGYRYPVQVVATVLSLDPQVRPDVVALLASSTAVMLTGVPFAGPVSGVRIAQVDNQFVINPSRDEQNMASLDMMVASNKDGVMMVEASARVISEEVISQALEDAHQANQILLDFQNKLLDQVDIPKQEYILITPTESITKFVEDWASDKIAETLTGDYAQRLAKIEDLKSDLLKHLETQLSEDELDTQAKLHLDALESLLHKALRQKIITEEKRLDGRGLDQVRPLSSQVGVLPRTHGSALFTRGATQALNIVTLASSSFSQLLETMDRDEERYYFHHYSAPGYTVGEVKRLGSPGRREIGHSYLAQRALEPVLPDHLDFPYTIRSVTEIMSQQGSTSMAATCSSCLALMDAGVPIKAPISGVAMGLILTPEGKPLVLTDIADAEDFAGDMDFKVAGSGRGITALQMDMKVAGLSVDILKQALLQSKVGRKVILDHMLSVLSAPRSKLNPLAPRVESLQIPVHKIKDLIGKGGETIQALTRETGAKIDIKDDGRVLVFSEEEASLNKALAQIEELTEEPEVGKIYRQREVVRIMDFGIFVNILHGHDGLVHVSEMTEGHLKHPSQLVKLGDQVDVKLTAIDEHGRLNLSMRQIKTKNVKK